LGWAGKTSGNAAVHQGQQQFRGGVGRKNLEGGTLFSHGC